MNNELVSIIIPVYNVEKYVEECVESVIKQTHENIEILLLDDGSTDGSGLLCDELSKRDNRIKVIHKANEGLGITRNRGISFSTGTYLMFLDSDDYIDRNTVSVMLEQALCNNVDLVISGFKKVTNEKSILFEEKYKYEIITKDNVKKLAGRMVGSAPDKRDSIFTMACGKLYSRESFIRANVLFPSERVIQSEDLAFQLDYIPQINGAVVLEDSFYYYRQTQGSLSLKYKENRFTEVLKVYDYVIDKAKQWKLPTDTKYRADKMLFVQLKGVIKQEVICFDGSFKEKNKRILNIIDNSQLQDIISTYPIKKLNYKQRAFVYMIKYKMALLLTILFSI